MMHQSFVPSSSPCHHGGDTTTVTPIPVQRRFLTPGVVVLLVLTVVGLCFALYRFAFGLEAATNLDQQHPWGIWIAIDVCTGVALSAGAFTTAALIHIFHREHFHAISRPALLTGALGYTFVGIGLLVDLGRYYNIWHPMWPTMWQGNSVLFEVGICVMCYLTVLYIEFIPVVCDRFIGDVSHPRLARYCTKTRHVVRKTMFLFIIAGVVLSCLHQSSLGNLMVIAPTKMNPLWYTPILPLLFLLSAIAVGFPMVIFESLCTSWALKRKPELPVLSALAAFIPPLLGVYLAFKVGDLVIRESWVHLMDGSVQSAMFIIEMVFGVVAPLIMLLPARARREPRWLFIASALIVLGVVLNRINVFLVAYNPPYAVRTYYPSFSEIAVTLGMISALILLYRLAVTHLPVLYEEDGKAGAT